MEGGGKGLPARDGKSSKGVVSRVERRRPHRRAQGGGVESGRNAIDNGLFRVPLMRQNTPHTAAQLQPNEGVRWQTALRRSNAGNAAP